MSKLQQKSLKYSHLSRTISELLYVSHYSKTVLLGISCVFSSMSYAESIIISNPDTTAIEESAQKKQEKVVEKIENASSVNTSQQEQNTVEVQQQEVNQAITQFQDEAVYQLNNAEIPVVDQQMVNEIYRIAEQAKQEARAEENQLPNVQNIIQNQQVNHEQVDSITGQQRQVDQLVQELQSDTVTLPELNLVSEESTLEKNAASTDEILEPKQKPGFFARLFGRDKEDNDEPVQALPKISVQIKGAEGELADNIKAKLSSFTMDAYHEFAMALPQLKEMTRQAAEAVGYFQAEFKFQKIDEKNLLVIVKPNQPVTVKSQNIEISGDGAKIPSFQVISVVPDLNIGDVFNQASYESTKTRITSAASDFGFFDGYWRMHDARVTVPDNDADINIKYETGERYKLHGVEFRMIGDKKELPLRQSVLEKLVPFKDGDDYASWRVNLLSSNLINSRYFNLALINVIKPDPLEKPLELPPDVQVLLQQQKAQEAEDLTTEKAQDASKAVDTDNIEFAGLNEKAQSASIDNNEQQSSQDSVEQESETEKLKQQAREEQQIPVIVYLNADKPNNLEAGIGYGTDTGVRLRSQYRRSIVNDRGHSFDANLELSEKRQSIDGRYMIPYKHPLNDYFGIIGGYEREVRDGIGQGVELDIESAVLGAERTIKKPLGEWQHNMSVRYRLDRISSNGAVYADDVPDAFKVISSDPEQESLLFGYEISRTDQDNRVNPTKGFRQFYRVEVGSQSLLTETDMAIVNAGWRFIYSLGENADHQFVGRGDLGYIVTDNFNQVPYNLRYFAGGDQSIRGYDYKSLGPREDDLLIGGQSLAVGSLEYNYQFKEGWRAAVFADVGNAYDEEFKTETKYGVGLGLRWASPVGPIRIDVGAGISEDSIPIRLHFFIGPPL